MKRNLVPIDEIGPAIRELVEERWPHTYGYDVLAEKVGCDASAIYGIAMVECASADFDLVDRILCGLGRFDHWYGRFAHIYPTQFMEKCALPSCSKTFPEYHRGGKHPKRYCSLKCCRLGQAMEAGLRPGTRHRQRGRCLRGHRMTPDNVVVRKRTNGGEMRQCATCRRESDRAYKQRKRERLAV